MSRRGPWVDAALAALLFLACALGVERAFDARLGEGLLRVGPLADRHHIEMGAIYAGYAREASESGALAMHDSQTATPHRGILLRPWEALLGRFAGGWGWHPERALELERLLAVPLAALGASLLFAACTASALRRRIALGIALFGGNLFWLVELSGRGSGLGQAARGWLGATFPRLSGLGFGAAAVHLGVPHLSLELGLFSLSVAAGVAAAARRSVTGAAGCGLLLLGLACVRPYTLPAAAAACAAAWVPGTLAGLRERRSAAAGVGAGLARTAAAWLALGVPSLSYALHVRSVLHSDTPFAELDVYHPAPPPIELAAFLGPCAFAALVLAALAALRRVRGAPGGGARGAPGGGELGWALGTWALVELLLVHGEPWVGWEVEAALPLGTLAVAVCVALLERWPVGSLADRSAAGRAATGQAATGQAAAGRTATGLLGALALLALAGSAAWVAELMERAGRPNDALILDQHERAALAFVEADRTGQLSADRPAAVLLCSAELAVLAPWLAGVRAFRGHPDHVPRQRLMLERQHAFLRAELPARQLPRYGVTHLLSGPRERALGGADADGLAAWLGRLPAFTSGGVAVWRVE